MDRVDQLLTVWNPYFEPTTIQVHVDILRKQRHLPHRRVWWGRLYRGDQQHFTEAEARKKWYEVANFVDRVRGEKRELVLYATNFQTLHALRVGRVVFGSDLPADEQPFVPEYYARTGCISGLWFEVLDVRALAFNQLDTLRFCLDHIGNEWGYDPFAAIWRWYPIVLPGAPVEQLFSREILRDRAPLFADLPETIYPPEVEHARKQLEGKVPQLWAGLEEKSRVFLASSWLVWERMGHASGFDLSAAIVGVSRALETEVCEGIFAPLHRVAESAWGSAQARERIHGSGLAGRLTLGYAARRLRELGPAAAELGLAELDRLTRNRRWLARLDRFVALRNQGAHGEELRVGQARARYREIFSDDSPLLALLPPKSELGARLDRAAG